MSQLEFDVALLHGDIIPEHSCSGEIVRLNQGPTYVYFAQCASCGTEFASKIAFTPTMPSPLFRKELPLCILDSSGAPV
jgi:hypothetical protein